MPRRPRAPWAVAADRRDHGRREVRLRHGGPAEPHFCESSVSAPSEASVSVTVTAPCSTTAGQTAVQRKCDSAQMSQDPTCLT